MTHPLEFLIGIALAAIAALIIALATYSDYAELRREECAKQDMRWNRTHDVCVPRITPAPAGATMARATAATTTLEPT
jgi:hypothetical protein